MGVSFQRAARNFVNLFDHAPWPLKLVVLKVARGIVAGAGPFWGCPWKKSRAAVLME
jgi:hypothetical protein